MSVVTPKTDFYELLNDITGYLEDRQAFQSMTLSAPDSTIVDLLHRCYIAMQELNGFDKDDG